MKHYKAAPKPPGHREDKAAGIYGINMNAYIEEMFTYFPTGLDFQPT